jgi:type II secretory ATPase GspE/PulE/Tfp pilus assembly ATPase PilB-like protein
LCELAKGGGRHIITVEDPAEQIIPGIMQTEVNEARGLDYARAARHLLRQDPQVLVIGEIRDDETAVIAVRAALTGHLVISTLHAGSCAGVFERLAAFCPDVSAIAGSTQLILNQRLVRKLCAQCHGAGCGTCLQTGYRSRVPLAEHLRVTPELRHCIANKDWEQLQAKPTLLDSAARLIADGITDRREVERILGRTL